MKNKSTKDLQYETSLKKNTYTPVFILGLHRSGTSILYKILQKTDYFNVITVYHILKYDELLYNFEQNLEQKEKDSIDQLFKNKGIVTRKIDNIEVYSEYAHEYGYILSKYSSSDRITKKNLFLFNQMCKKISYISNNSKMILLKNPFDFSNFLFIKQYFPQAKFIFIHRNPIDIISSSIRAWKVLLESKNEYTAIFSRSYQKMYSNPLLLFFNRCIHLKKPINIISEINSCSRELKYYMNNIGYLKVSDYFELTYEQLCSTPQESITRILTWLEFEPQTIDAQLMIQQRNLKIPDEVKRYEQYIYKKMEQYFTLFNFTFDKKE